MNPKQNGSVRIEWFFDAKVPVVWSMWTEPDKVKLWFGSDPKGKVMDAKINLREGGGYEVTFQNVDRSEYTCFGNYRDIQPYTCLVFTWAWKNRPDHIELVNLEFADDQDGTRMTFSHSEIDQETSHNYAEGWRTTFGKLERAIAQFA
jgi:uncharacterized protein YndB with AHSA1/START domain